MAILVTFSFPRKGIATIGAMNAPKAKLKCMLCIYGPASSFSQISRHKTFPPVSKEPLAKLAITETTKNSHR